MNREVTMQNCVHKFTINPYNAEFDPAVTFIDNGNSNPVII